MLIQLSHFLRRNLLSSNTVEDLKVKYSYEIFENEWAYIFSNAVQILRGNFFKEHCNGWVDFVSAELIRLQIRVKTYSTTIWLKIW